MTKQLTAVIQCEGRGLFALCPELDIASQGATVEEARHYLQEAFGLYFECAPPEDDRRRMSGAR